ncbi:hypothetical protein GCM10025875_37460 [Litorihabitans aurantiacus]|uniref:HTH araC/xylS-type domain-containing protein n=1 Tax=Litorihabitans aurantiacus TaxID=1930061 RepID=A0AA37XIR7_9MICO|nr:hypothetical protein GCM10025875_37460 [Litorihabitans aurantiacus]
MNWRLDPAVVVEVAAQLPRQRGDDQPARLGTMTYELADAVERLLTLLDAPQEAAVLAPLLSREIVLRLLQSDQAPRLLAAAEHARADVVGAAIARMDQALADPWTVESIASAAGTSPATLRRRFRELTGLTPMHYLKRLRLGEARRAMVVDGLSAAQASVRVGYLSASHFSRDYRATYGRPPGADGTALRAQLRAG